MQPEIWKPVPFAPGYAISSRGRLVSARSNAVQIGHGYTEIDLRALRFIHQPTTNSGYKRVELYVKGKRVFWTTSRLALTVFVGPSPSPEMQAAHIDGDRLNNAVGNLRWATPKENNDDKYLHGTILYGTNNPKCKIDINMAQKILMARASGVSVVKLAKQFNVARSQIDKVVYGRHWTTKFTFAAAKGGK